MAITKQEFRFTNNLQMMRRHGGFDSDEEEEERKAMVEDSIQEEISIASTR